MVEPKVKPPGAVVKEVSDQTAVKRPNPYGSSTTWVSLKAQEDTEKSRWAARLQKIATKAGAAAKINGPARDGLSAKEDEAIKAIVLKSGAFRTMRQNVRAWEKFDQWATEVGVGIYPPTDAVVVKYSLYLESSGCGPSVIPAFFAEGSRWMLQDGCLRRSKASLTRSIQNEAKSSKRQRQCRLRSWLLCMEVRGRMF